MTDYCTTDEVKDQIERVQATGDTVIDALVTAASRAIDRFTNRPENYYVATAVAGARLFAGSGGPVQRIDDCIAITAVAVKDSVSSDTYTAWAATDYVAFRGDYRFPEFNQTPYTALMAAVNGDHSNFTSGLQVGGISRGDLIFGEGMAGNWRTYYNPRQAHAQPTVQVTARWGYAAEVPEQIKQAAIIQSARWFKRGQSSFDDTLASAELGQLVFRLELDPDVKMILARWMHVPVGRK